MRARRYRQFMMEDIAMDFGRALDHYVERENASLDSPPEDRFTCDQVALDESVGTKHDPGRTDIAFEGPVDMDVASGIEPPQNHELLPEDRTRPGSRLFAAPEWGWPRFQLIEPQIA